MNSPFRLRQEQNVSLFRKDFGDGIPVGLFFSREEFNLLCAQYDNSDAFDASFLRCVYDMTNGHVGACCDMLRVICNHSKFKHAIHLCDFQCSHTGELMKNLNDLTLFTRGLPLRRELQKTNIADVFRKVLHDGGIVAQEVSENLPLQECFHRGWLHNEPVDDSDGPFAYICATPLHKHYVHWMLFGNSG
ncbi:hypothetical protein BD410DRAFT_273156 [Rickenella mellea]|uniref:Uncharacterized protein n=1 Tax=Rickenella mellea TaxID=50990 RepID=A0A4Y7Q4L4_9AGAM|nr:hypothetical protein BD410DRAFT_273156 [Rickenella mellea]